MTELTFELIKDWLLPVEDPELFMSLVDLGLIYGCNIDVPAQKVTVQMTLTSPGCPAADYLVSQVKNRLLEHPQIKDAEVEVVFEPKWDPKEMASEEAKERLGIW